MILAVLYQNMLSNIDESTTQYSIGKWHEIIQK